MKLYLVTTKKAVDYDQYDGMVVAARSSEDALTIDPHGMNFSATSHLFSPNQVDIEYLGEAGAKTKRGLILASFRAG